MHSLRPKDPRPAGLGALHVLPDELLTRMLSLLDAWGLLALGAASKLLRLLCCEEPLWLQLHLDCCKRPFTYKGSWRATYACAAAGREVPLAPTAPVPGFTSDFLYRRWYRCNVDLSSFTPPETMCGVVHVPDASVLTPQEFEQRFDLPGQPALLGGLAAGWPLADWQPEALGRRLGDALFKVTKPGAAGGRTRMQLADYLEYAAAQRDEEPLYIFDSSFGEAAPALLGSYRVPPLFAHDLFACLGYRREDFRWLVAGPARSGASWHVDPSATSAWNTLLAGRKRWALYAPGSVPPGVFCRIDDDGQPSFEGPTSLQWFLEVYPRLPPARRPLEVVQHAGDTVFVPSGWWHCVLNLDMTMAVTQNFVSPANLEAVVAYQSLGAGSLVDPNLIPAFLERQAVRRGGATPAAAEELGKGPRDQGPGQASGGSGPDLLDGGEANSEEEDEGEGKGDAAARAREHLERLPFGFSADGSLCPWLRRLWLEVPALQPRLLELTERLTDLQEWGALLERACAAARLRPPQAHARFPLAGGECVVFEVDGAIAKFYNTHLQRQAAAMCELEAAAYACLQAAAAAGAGAASAGAGTGGGDTGAARAGRAASQLLAAGALPAPPGLPGGSEGGGELHRIPFLVVTKAPGCTLGSCMDTLSQQQWLDVGAAAGVALAALHRASLPGVGTCGAAGCAGMSCGLGSAQLLDPEGDAPSTAWVAKEGVAFSSRLGRVDLREAAAAAGAAGQQVAAVPDAGSGSVGAAVEPVACPACRAWRPFCSFLRLQRGRAVRLHRSNRTLPPQLLEQLEAFLPEDPATLVGCGGACSSAGRVAGGTPGGGSCSAAGGGVLPTWVHGDLTAENLLLDRSLGGGPAVEEEDAEAVASNRVAARATVCGDASGHAASAAGPSASSAVRSGSVTLIDFGDAGHGDPLYDLPPLCLRSLRGEPAAQACVEAYLGARPPPWPRRAPSLLLSHVAMCYTLLHELELMGAVFKRRPELWEAKSLVEVQAAVWGWLNRAVEGQLSSS